MASVGSTVDSLYTPWATQSSIDERDARFALAGYAVPQPGSVMSYKSGVFAGGAISGATLGDSTHGGLRVQVATTGSSPSVTVNVGNCLIDTPSNGPYLAGLDAVKTLPLAAPSATQSRYDLIVGRIYDDRNSAIASTAGVRKFSVQAVTGDNSSGTPVVPTSVLPANGWIPLAYVLIGPNGTSVTLEDKRGPGLAARGGRRILYGADAKITSAAFLEAGAYAGDQRYVVGHPFPNQTYYVSSDAGTAGWRGDSGELVYTFTFPNVGTRSQTGGGTMTDLVTGTIPAFGVPVTITPQGRWNPNVDGGVICELRAKNGSDLIAYTSLNTWGQTGRLGNAIGLPPVTRGPYTTAQTITMDMYMRGGSGASTITWDTSDVGQHILQVIVKPANIDPIKVWL